MLRCKIKKWQPKGTFTPNAICATEEDSFNVKSMEQTRSEAS